MPIQFNNISHRLKTVALIIVAIIVMSGPGSVLAAECIATPKLLEKTRLDGLSEFWFGSPDFRFAILLATNSRVSDPRFTYISNPNHLPASTAKSPSHVCIPGIDEAERLKHRFDQYLEAVHDMALAEPSEAVDTLNPVPESGAVTVVSWVRSDQLKNFPSEPGSPVTTTDAMWVTLAPNLQEFCRDFSATVSANPNRVILRLEQRLGLPPAASKTHFIEMEIATPADGISLFRPCGNPDVTTTSCTPGGPVKCDLDDTNCHRHADFFVNQYYSSYGTARPVEYPWTSLGYTFDWAHKPAGLGSRFDFVQVGESEYVVPPGTTLKLVSITPTGRYCGLKN